MNFDERNNSVNDDSDSGHSVDQESQNNRHHRQAQEVTSLPFAPLDPEWVSPFTLPPLPALRKTRGPSKLRRSPEERLHQRSTSSAYYAAAWGSPYATPSPNRSPPSHWLRRRSQEPETASPLSSKTRKHSLKSLDPEHIPQTLGLKPPQTFGARRRASSWDRSKTLSERSNWLSESELSGSEADIAAGKTPTRNTYLKLKSLKEAVDRVQVPRSQSHQVQDSVATITPESFNAAGVNPPSPNHDVMDSPVVMEQTAGENLEAGPPSGDFEKPLPSLPLLNTQEHKADLAINTGSPESPSRPRMLSTQSFLRPKRKVVWKGKTCIIALPLTDRESAGLPPVLGSDEIRRRMAKWAAEGYDVDRLSVGGPQDISPVFGQSRALFPDPGEMYAERKKDKLHVHVPDQDEWEAWVEYLKEERLRALGVTPSNSEPPMSVHSPFSSTLSRVSSTYPGLAASPPVGTLSANGNHVRIAGHTFSPPLGRQGSVNSHPGSHVASPSISGYPGPMHGYKQSIAHPRLTSPYDYPVSHPGSFNVGMRNNSAGYGVRQFSPPAAFNLQSLGQVLTPPVPVVPSNDNSRGTRQNPTMDQIRQQQHRQQQLHQHMMHHSRQLSYFPPPQSKSADHLPQTPIAESPSRTPPEIMHPTPRSHRHNLSAALQRGVDDAEAFHSDRQPPVHEVDEKQLREEDAGEKSIPNNAEYDQTPDLPVLRRPEILPNDGDDDRSEIETNPSIAASPMLMDEQNAFVAPLSNLPQIKAVLQSHSHHKPNLSISKLNVKAPEFNPQGGFSSANFSFGGHSFQPLTSPPNQFPNEGVRPSFASRNLSISKLNVEAPAFTPSTIINPTPSKDTTSKHGTPAKQSMTTPSKSNFTFSSPTFNVEAPEFRPGQSFSFTASANSQPGNNQASFTSAGSIFGNISIDPTSKVNRRGTKIIPTLRPKSSEGGVSDEQGDDDEGRISAPSDRQKRARRAGDEDDEELLFATTAPFDTTEGLSTKKEESIERENNNVSSTLITAENANSKHVDKVPVAEPEPKEEAEITHARKLSDNLEKAQVDNTEAVPMQQSAVKSPSIDSALISNPPDTLAHSVTISGAEPSDGHERTYTDPIADTAEVPSLDTDVVSNQLQNSRQQSDLGTSNPPNNHRSKFSLSALAKPFELRPEAAADFIPQTSSSIPATPEPKKSRGLMASRYANASPGPGPEPEPEPESTTIAAQNDSLLVLQEDVEPEHANTSQAEPLQTDPQQGIPSTGLPSVQHETVSQLVGSIERPVYSVDRVRSRSLSPSQSSMIDELGPSFEEIDAVMKQFEDNPDLGVERDATPVKPTPSLDLRLAPAFRSDAPSPSPKRMTRSPQRGRDWGMGICKLNDSNVEVSDWNDEFSPRQIDKLQRQAQNFDKHVHSLVDGMLENRLGPFEHTLQAIQTSLVDLTNKKTQLSGHRKSSVENRENSDADDEDDYGAFEAVSAYRSRSPSRNQRKAEKIRAIVTDAIAAHKMPIPEKPDFDLSEIHAALEEMRRISQAQQDLHSHDQLKMRAMVEDVLTNHSSLKDIKKQTDYDAIEETNRQKVHALETSLQEAEKWAEEQADLRRTADDSIKTLNARLSEAQEEVTRYRKGSEEAQLKMAMLVKKAEDYEILQSRHADVVCNNRALEDTLSEYRVTSDQFREDIKLERARNEDLIRRMHNLREDFNEKSDSRQVLRTQLERLQNRMAQVMDDVHAEEAEWRMKEHELVLHNRSIQAALEHEIKHRERVETDVSRLDKEYKETIRFKTQYEHAQHEISRLQEHVAKLTGENKSQQDISFNLERELAHAKQSTQDEVSQAASRVQSELEAARATIESLQSGSDAQISRLQKRLDDAELDLEEQKAKHDAVVSETSESHNQALHEANQKRESALEEMLTSHERKLNDLRERHTRALHNSSDDRHRLEYHLNEKLSISEERHKHLESQIKDLEERLEITKSAARAAVEAATAKSVNIPTPAPSVAASPPQRAFSASLRLSQGTDLPEKISPQAMRESIMVLQEQLLNREQRIEQLEAEIAAVDKDAPLRLKERDNEIVLLRELLSVRVDDLNEIISVLSQPKYDREATKNAAIRLKANLQMEQQLKERAAVIGGIASSLPTLSTLSSLAPSPRGLPLAAAAAWGNWRKARDFGLNAVTDMASNISQTPSKSATGSPSSLLAGLMTPPNTSQRTPSPSRAHSPSPPSMRPLAAAAASRKTAGSSSEVRPLRPFSTQARTLSSRQAEKRRESTESTSSSEAGKGESQPWPETPTTSTISRGLRTLDLGEDVDEDASPLDTSEPHSHAADREPGNAVVA